MSMKDRQEIKAPETSCEHCGRTFIRESTLLKHLCEQKRRWLDRDRPANRIGYGAWKNYYNSHHPNKKSTEYKDFLNSHYYGAFIKFGIYCTDIGAINPTAFAGWLVKNNVPIDSWPSDRSYTKYLAEYLRAEDPYEAVRRSLDVLLDISNAEGLRLGDVFKYSNSNKLCHLVTCGKISPWVLYHSLGGVNFLGKLDSSQVALVSDYIDPEKWNIKFKRDPVQVTEIKALLDKTGL